MKKIFSVMVLIFLGISLFAGAGAEQKSEYPSKSITLIVPFGAGGGTDALARKLAEIAQKQNGISIIVENKTGGSGAVGMTEGSLAKPDGYTITMTTVEVVLLPATGLVSFKPEDFRGIIRVNFDAAALIVKKNNPANSLGEFIANAKKAPKPVSVNVSAFPTNFWLCGAMLKEVSGANLNLVEEPNGAAQEVANLLGGHVDSIVCTLAEAAQYVASGDFKFLAVASAERSPIYQDVPTFKEQGYDIEVGTWRGFMVPKATDESIVAKLDRIFTNAYKDPEFKDFLKKMGFGEGYLNSADFAELVKNQKAQYTPVIQKYK